MSGKPGRRQCPYSEPGFLGLEDLWDFTFCQTRIKRIKEFIEFSCQFLNSGSDRIFNFLKLFLEID